MRFVYCGIILLMNLGVSSQNLVSNSDFESFSNAYCTSGYPPPGMYELCTGWFNAASSGGSSVDHVCNNSATGGMPQQLFSPLPLNPPSGTGALGFGSGGSTTPGISEAVYTNLSSTITSGTAVNISLAISPRSSTLSGQVNDPNILLGLYFYTTNPIPLSGNHLTVTPQVVIPTASLTLDTWTTYTTSYTLTANASKVAIGFFNPTSNGSTIFRYFAIDDVSIVANPCGACPSGGSGTTWTWTGCQDTDWFNACNWDRQSVPTVSSNVIIPSVTNDPLVNSGTANCLDITIQTGATVNINSTGGAVLNVTKP